MSVLVVDDAERRRACGTGVTPVAYQDGYQNPLGRVVQLSFRKQF